MTVLEHSFDFSTILDHPIVNEKGDRRYLMVLLDITRRCNQRCKHCFYYRDDRSKAEEIPTDRFIQRLYGLKRRYGFISALWEGGEPMIRKDLLVQGVEHFEFNIIPTNGMLTIPRLPRSIVVVSLDGPQEINDDIRGRGSFERATRNVSRALVETDNRIHYQCTICLLNQDYIEALTEDLMRLSTVKLLFSFYVPQIGETNGQLGWNTNAERDPIVERVLKLKMKHPEFILNKVEETERLFSDRCEAYTDTCFLKRHVLPLRADLEERMFCCYGDLPDCRRCGSWAVFHYTDLTLSNNE